MDNSSGEQMAKCEQRGYPWRPISFIGHMVGVDFVLARKEPSCGPFGTKWSQSINEGLTSHQPPSRSNAYFCFRTWVTWSITSYWYAFKLEDSGDGLVITCTNLVGWGWVIRIISLEACPFYARILKEFVRFYSRKNWHLLCGIILLREWIERNHKAFNQ